MSMSELRQAVQYAQTALDAKFDQASTALTSHEDRRTTQALIDDFLAESCRHANTVCEVILPDVGKEHGMRWGYVEATKHLEKSAVSAKRHSYGEAHMADASWDGIWEDLVAEYKDLRILEQHVLDQLGQHVDDARSTELARQFREEIAVAPTRPHPHLPHTGKVGHMAHRLWAKADRVWDSVEGRSVKH